MADEEALRKIRSVEEQIDILNKKLSIAKQVCGLIITFLVTKPLLGAFTLTRLPPSVGGGCSAERDGRDGPGLRGHAGTEHPPDAAAPRKRRRQLQADERANQVQPDPQAAEGGEGGACRPTPHFKNAGEATRGNAATVYWFIVYS